MVVFKFLSATSAGRAHGDRLPDAADISHLVSGDWSAEDTGEAARMVGLTAPAAPEELVRMIDDLRHGRPVTI